MGELEFFPDTLNKYTIHQGKLYQLTLFFQFFIMRLRLKRILQKVILVTLQKG